MTKTSAQNSHDASDNNEKEVDRGSRRGQTNDNPSRSEEPHV